MKVFAVVSFVEVTIADVVWQTMFYSGGAVAVGRAATKTLGTVAMNWIARR